MPFYDRSDLIALTTQVVERNLLRGMLLVVVVLIFFLYDFRAGLIVATTIPLALLFAFICLDLQNASANLLSIGAVDFGILVDGAVVMVENIFRQIAARKGTAAQRQGNHRGRGGGGGPPALLRGRGDRGRLPADLCPVRALPATLFKPMADTMVFALVGSLIVTLTLLPVLCCMVHAQGRAGAAQRRLRSHQIGLHQGSRFLSRASLGHDVRLGHAAGGFAAAHSRASAPSSCRSWTKARCGCAPRCPTPSRSTNRRRSRPRCGRSLRSFPEVTTVASELGRPDDGTDPTGFFNVEFYVGLKPYSQWNGAYRNKAGLIEAINQKLEAFPGIIFNYTQPAEDAVDEAETGLKSALAVKVFGSDLETLQQKGKAIKQILERVRGIRDVTLVQELGQPSLTIKINRAKIARYGLNVADINGLIQTAIGGDVATQVVQDEKQFDLVVRLEQQYRDNPEEIGNILVATPAGQQIPLKEFADIQVTNGASFIYRQDNSRYIGVQFSVEGRDLAGAVDDAIAAGQRKGHACRRAIGWIGAANTRNTRLRAQQLNVILPLTLFLIFLLLFALYSNFKFPFITVLGVLLSAPVGGIVALWITGTPFSVSSGIGFLALFGVSVQTAVVYISYVNELRRDGTPLDRGHSPGRDPAAAPHHDDRAGGGVGPAAGGAGHGRRHGFPAAVRAGHRQRPVHATADQHLPDAGALCPGRASRTIGWKCDAAYRVHAAVTWWL